MMDTEKLAEFFVKLTAVVFFVYALEIIYLAVFDIVFIFNSHANHFPTTSSDFIWGNMSPEIYRNACFSLFYIVLGLLFWIESARISQLVLKRIK